MKERTAWPLILALAWMLSWVEPLCRAAQPAASPSPNPPLSLPSTVSPEIERFVKRSGRDAPSASSSTPNAKSAAKPVVRRPPPLPPSTVAPEIERFVKRSGRDLSAAKPGGSSSSGPVGVGDKFPEDVARSSQTEHPLLNGAPFGSSDVRYPINLATALRLSDARPLIVAAAQARAWVAEAQLTEAKLLWVPDVNLGFTYYRHDGGGPDFNKGIMTAVSLNFFYGGGGLFLFVATTDAIYQPLVARQVLNARQWDIQTAKNDALLQTAEAYFLTHRYRGVYAGTLYTVDRARKLVNQIAELSRDLAPAYEVDRARFMLADLEQKAALARQQWQVQSARLTRVLRLDPRVMIEPREHDHAQITLIDPGREFDDLMPIALTNRPEIASRRALIEAADAEIRREKARPFLPTILFNGYQPPGGMLMQGGLFGLGPNDKLDQFRFRSDVSIQFVWQLQNFGLGNLARIKERRAHESRAIIDLRKAQDSVAEEVTQSLARVQSAAVRVVQADRSMRTGIIALNGATEGLGQTSRFGDVLRLVSRPQEAIYALELYQVAFNEYFSTVAEYNIAQFELFHALGYPAADIALIRPPGEVLPVDTSRPAYLPPVGVGPPPATR